VKPKRSKLQASRGSAKRNGKPRGGDAAVRVAYKTKRGLMVQGLAEQALASPLMQKYKGKVRLIFFSPPYPLRTKKRYGNRSGQSFVYWLASLAPTLAEFLDKKGSIVIEMGNAWEPGRPVMSVLGIQSLLRFMEAGELDLCQQFICENPARLPGPAQWVNVERIRVKDSFTHVWWMARGERPDANNKRVLTEYSPAMEALLKRKSYNAGARPSQHHVSKRGFLTRHGGAIPSNVLRFSNTSSQDEYLRHCRDLGIDAHPARMPAQLAEFFIKFLTRRGDIVLDPFAGSNTTGATAERLERKWLAIEPTADYIRGSAGRFGPKHPKIRRLALPKRTPKKSTRGN
jgi:hypothetical protein